MFGRPTVDELLLAVLAFLVFAAVHLASDSSGDTVTPSATKTSTSVPTVAATTVGPPSAAIRTAVPTGTATTPTTAAAGRDPRSCNFRDELERVRGAVVRIRAVLGSTEGSVGTGFHIGNGEYVTAAHVVQDDFGNTLGDIWVESAVTGRSVSAEVVRIGSFSVSGTTQQRDLAVLRAPAIEHALNYRAPKEDDAASDVRSLGYPWSQARDDSTNIPAPVVLRGVLSSTAERDTIEIVQSDVRVQSGMSGGPLVDECGDALAVAASLPQPPGTATGEGIGVFISVTELAKLR